MEMLHIILALGQALVTEELSVQIPQVRTWPVFSKCRVARHIPESFQCWEKAGSHRVLSLAVRSQTHGSSKTMTLQSKHSVSLTHLKGLRCFSISWNFKMPPAQTRGKLRKLRGSLNSSCKVFYRLQVPYPRHKQQQSFLMWDEGHDLFEAMGRVNTCLQPRSSQWLRTAEFNTSLCLTRLRLNIYLLTFMYIPTHTRTKPSWET